MFITGKSNIRLIDAAHIIHVMIALIKMIKILFKYSVGNRLGRMLG
jgi:hypothetical protein